MIGNKNTGERMMTSVKEYVNELIAENKKLKATLTQVQELQGRTFGSLNSIPVGLPLHDKWIEKSKLDSILNNHDN